MRYMVIEHFKEGKTENVYRRFAEKGRLTPTGLHYVDSWVSTDLRVCYQLMVTDEFELFGKWIKEWEDLIEFEIVPVFSSSEARDQALASS